MPTPTIYFSAEELSKLLKKTPFLALPSSKFLRRVKAGAEVLLSEDQRSLKKRKLKVIIKSVSTFKNYTDLLKAGKEKLVSAVPLEKQQKGIVLFELEFLPG